MCLFHHKMRVLFDEHTTESTGVALANNNKTIQMKIHTEALVQHSRTINI